MIRNGFVLFFFLLFSSNLYAQPRIQATSDTLKIAVGESETVPLFISGSGSFKASVSLPNKKWKADLYKSQIELGGSQTEIVRIGVPEKTRQGIYPLVYKLTDDSKQAKKTVYIKVPLRRKVEAKLGEILNIIVKGSSPKVSLVVKNKSNVKENINIKGDFKTKFSLKPGQSKELSVPLPASQSSSGSISLVVENSEGTVEHFHRNYQVASSPEKQKLSRFTYPVRSGVRTSLENRFGKKRSFTQVWMDGEGRLSNASETKLDFNLRSPPLQNFSSINPLPRSAFSSRSLYRASLFNPNYKLRFGDQNFRRTKLTGNTASGFGIGGQYNVTSQTHVNSFYSGSRYYSRTQFGASLSHQLSESHIVSTNIGHNRSSFFTGTAVSGRSFYNNESGLLQLKSELSLDFASETTGVSLMKDVRFGSSNHYIRSRYARYSSSNPSFQRGSQRFLIQGSTELLNTKLFSSYRYNDTSYRFSNNVFKVGLSQSIFNLEYRRQFGGETQRDHLKASLFLRGKSLSFNTSARVGWTSYESETTRSEKYEATIRYKNEKGFRGSLRGHYRAGSLGFYSGSKKRYGVHTNFSYNWKKKRVYLSSSVKKNRGVYHSHSAGGTYQTNKGTRLKLGATYKNSFTGWWGVEFEVSRPIDVPLKKDQTAGLAAGRVVDGDGKPIEDMVVFVGNEASVTNKNGEYAIQHAPGDYDIRLSPSKLDPSKIVKGTSTGVNVIGGEKTHRTVKVYSGASVEGSVFFQNGEPAEGVTLKIFNGQKSYYKVTNSGGKVQFFGLVPGQWNLKFVSEQNENIKSTSEFKQTFELKSGENGSFEINVEKDDEINFLNEEPN